MWIPNEKEMKKLGEKMTLRVSQFGMEDRLVLKKLEISVNDLCFYKNQNSWENVKEIGQMIENQLDKIYRVYGIACSVDMFIKIIG